MYFQGNGKDQPQLLWEHQRWSSLLSSPNLRRIKVKKSKTRFQKGETNFGLHLGELWPATFPSKPAKLCPSEGRQTGGKSSRLTCSPEQHRCCCFGSLIYGWIKFLLVFRRAMSLTCLVKLKSLWRTTSVTWSSLYALVWLLNSSSVLQEGSK